MPKKPHEIFEVRLQKIVNEKGQTYIVIEVIEQS